MYHEIPLARLAPSKLNPREHFDDASLTELKDSIRAHGVLENLIVRPAWCAGCVTGKDLEAADQAPAKSAAGESFEIVSGERRYRAALAALGAQGMVPVRVKELTDPELIEINLTEQMQRNQLTPLEEGKAFSRLLGYKGDDGTPLHTYASLAARVSKGEEYVRVRVALLSLPAPAKKAMAAGTLVFSVARAIARIPREDDRAEAAKQILAGHGQDQAFTAREAEELIAEKFMVDLKNAPFDRESAELLPSAGVCSTCQYRTGNNPDFAADPKRGHLCTNPACYREKCDAEFSRQAVIAMAAGARVLDDAESRKLFETHRPAELRWNAEWVDVDTRPAAHLLKSEVKNPPQWSELVAKAKAAGMKPELLLAKDGHGRARLVVSSTLLIAACEKLGEPIFSKAGVQDSMPIDRRPGEDDEDAFRRGQRELAERQRAEAKKVAEMNAGKERALAQVLRAVHAGLAKKWVCSEIWKMMLSFFLDTLTPATEAVLHRLLAGAQKNKLRAAVGKLKEPERQALVPLLLIGHTIPEKGIDSPGLQRFAQFAGVDVKQIQKAALSDKPPPRAIAKKSSTEKRRGKRA